MAKAKLTTRAISTTAVTSDNLAKGSQLTHNQLDSNFLNLRDATFGVVADDSATIQIGMDSNLYLQGGDNVTTSTDSAGVVTINATSDVTASSSTTFTNKTIDVDNNTVSNIEVDNLKSGVLDTDLASVSGSDDTLASAKAIESYVDSSAGSGWRVVGDDSAGVDIAEGGTLYIQGGTNVTTATDSAGVITINAADTTLSLIDEDDMSTDSATRPPSQQSVKAYVDGQNHTSLSGSTDNTIATVTGANALAGEANLTFDGSTLAVTGAATISTTLGVTGASTLDGVTVSDNTISTNASNANLELSGNGSGGVKIGGIHVASDNVISTAASDSTTLTITTQGSGNISLTAETISLNSSVHIGLGGDSAGGLIIEDNTIKTARSNENIELVPSGTGSVHVQTSAIIDQVTITDNTISSNASNANLEINANGSGTVVLENLSVAGDGATVTGILDEDAMGSNSAVKLATQQSIKAYVDANAGGTTGDITFVGSTIISPSNADLTLNPAGTGKVNINAVYTLPNADGSANQVLGTNGSGVLSFRDPTAINIDGGVADSDYTSVPTIDGGTA